MSFTFSREDRFDELPPKIKEYLPVFIQNRWEDFLKFEKALAEKNFEMMRDYCHKQIGVATCYNCFRLYDLVLYIQEQARAENHEKLVEVFPELRTYLEGLRGQSK